MENTERVSDRPLDTQTFSNLIPPNLSAQLSNLESGPLLPEMGDFEDLRAFDQQLAALGYTPQEELRILVALTKDAKENVRLAAVRTLMARRTELVRKAGIGLSARKTVNPDGSTSTELMAKGMMYVTGQKKPDHAQDYLDRTTPTDATPDPPGGGNGDPRQRSGGDPSPEAVRTLGREPGTTEILSRRPKRNDALPGLSIGYGLRTTSYRATRAGGGDEGGRGVGEDEEDRGRGGQCDQPAGAERVVRGVGNEGDVGESTGVFPPHDEVGSEGWEGETDDEVERSAVPEESGADPVGVDGGQHQECQVGGSGGGGSHGGSGGDRIAGIYPDAGKPAGLSAVRTGHKKKEAWKRGKV